MENMTFKVMRLVILKFEFVLIKKKKEKEIVLTSYFSKRMNNLFVNEMECRFGVAGIGHGL